jgi:hypothetical protein
MKSGLVKRLLGEMDEEREPTPSLTASATGMSRYPMDAEATKEAVTMVGDGQMPDVFFVTIGTGFLNEEPEAEDSYCVFKTSSGADAEVKFNEIVLDGQEGPQWVQIENRLKGLVKQRRLARVVSYSEETQG